jgi:hypothetical protein
VPKVKCLVSGAVHRKGVGKDSGKEYDFAVIYVLNKAEPLQNGRTMVAIAAGCEVAEVRTSRDVVQSMQVLQFPQEMELEIQSQFGRMRNLEPVCVKATPSKPAVSAAARLAGVQT